jgi:hypothetical protein
VGWAPTALAVVRGELDCGTVAVTGAVRLRADDTGCGALRTAGARVTGCGDCVACDVVVTGSGPTCGSGSGLGVSWPNAGEGTANDALRTTAAVSAARVRPSRAVRPCPVYRR